MAPAQVYPRDARLISLLLSSNPSISDVQPQVLLQLLEFSHRYTAQVLSDCAIYAEHAGRPGNVQLDDLTLAVQARAGWEGGGRIPKEYVLSLAQRTNAVPLPSIPETYGVRLPPTKHCLTAVDFDLVPNRPPAHSDYYREEEGEVNGVNGSTMPDGWGNGDGEDALAEGDEDGAGEEDAAGDEMNIDGGAEMEVSGLFGDRDEELNGDDDDDDNDGSVVIDPLAGLQPLSNGFGGMVSMGMEGPGDDAADYTTERRPMVEDEDYDM